MIDAVASRAAKQTGMQLALDMSGDWPAAVLPELAAWLVSWKAAGNDTMTVEQFRAVARNQPASAKAWGSLPRIAKDLIEPARRADGSIIKRPAESVRTHGHDVTVYRILVGASSSQETGARAASEHHESPAEAVYQPQAGERVGECRHGGNASELLSATASYHRTRAAMGGQG